MVIVNLTVDKHVFMTEFNVQVTVFIYLVSCE